LRIVSVTSIGTLSLRIVDERYLRKSCSTKFSTLQSASRRALFFPHAQNGLLVEVGNRYSEYSPGRISVLGTSFRFSPMRFGSTCSTPFLVISFGMVMNSAVM